MRKSKSLLKVTGIFLLVSIVAFISIKKIFVFRGQYLEDILYKSKNLLIQKLEKSKHQEGRKTLVVLGNGWNTSVDSNNKVTTHDPFFLLPKTEVRLLSGKNYEIITAYFPFESLGLNQAGWELAQFINNQYKDYRIILLGHSKSAVCFANASKWLEANGLNATIITVSAPYGGVNSDKENCQRLNAFQQWLYPKIIVSHRTNDDITKSSPFLLKTADFSGVSTRNFYCVKSILPEKSINPIDLVLEWVDSKFEIEGDGIVGWQEQKPPIKPDKEFVVKKSHQGSMQEAIKILKKEGIL